MSLDTYLFLDGKRTPDVCFCGEVRLSGVEKTRHRRGCPDWKQAEMVWNWTCACGCGHNSIASREERRVWKCGCGESTNPKREHQHQLIAASVSSDDNSLTTLLGGV